MDIEGVIFSVGVVIGFVLGFLGGKYSEKRD